MQNSKNQKDCLTEEKRYFFCRDENVVYICTRFRNGAISSAGSEHLPYKQRVGGSNPSSPTNIKGVGFTQLLLIFKKPFFRYSKTYTTHGSIPVVLDIVGNQLIGIFFFLRDWKKNMFFLERSDSLGCKFLLIDNPHSFSPSDQIEPSYLLSA